MTDQYTYWGTDQGYYSPNWLTAYEGSDNNPQGAGTLLNPYGTTAYGTAQPTNDTSNSNNSMLNTYLGQFGNSYEEGYQSTDTTGGALRGAASGGAKAYTNSKGDWGSTATGAFVGAVSGYLGSKGKKKDSKNELDSTVALTKLKGDLLLRNAIEQKKADYAIEQARGQQLADAYSQYSRFATDHSPGLLAGHTPLTPEQRAAFAQSAPPQNRNYLAGSLNPVVSSGLPYDPTLPVDNPYG